MYRKPNFLTFTGADSLTDVREMMALSARYPIEWGILFSPTRQGNDHRYPSEIALASIVASGMRMSAHLCGGHSRAIMEGGSFSIPFLKSFQRIQVNHKFPDPTKIVAYLGAENVIAQTREAFPDNDLVEWLFDRSGGKGREPEVWPSYPGRFVGFAGGIGPNNVLEVIERIDANGPYWIDMETKVRTDDHFDLNLCRAVCERVYRDL